MTPQQLQADWLAKHQPTKCKCAGYRAKRTPKHNKSTQTTDSTCIVIKSTTPTVCKRTQDLLVNCQAIQSQLEQEVQQFTSQHKQRRTDAVNAMLSIFGD